MVERYVRDVEVAGSNPVTPIMKTKYRNSLKLQGTPVFLTKKWTRRILILDMKEYDRMKATLTLFSKLEEGEQSARERGWIPADDLERELGLISNTGVNL